MFFYFINLNCIVFLSIEILIKIKDPLNCNYKRRVMIYHLLSTITSLGVAILLCSVDNDGVSSFDTCFIQKGSIYELLVLVPICFHFPLCLLTCFYILWAARRTKHSGYAKHHIYIVLTFLITRGPAALTDGLNYEKFYIKGVGIIDKVMAK